jgi:hypothetical protein
MRLTPAGRLTLDQADWLAQVRTPPRLFWPAEMQVMVPTPGQATPSSTEVDDG